MTTMENLELDNWEMCLKYGERNFYKNNTSIYEINQPGKDGFYFLKRGLVEISTTNYNGEERILDIVSADNSFGEPTIDGTPYFTNAFAIKDSVVYFFSYQKLESLMKEDRHLSLFMSQLMSNSLSNRLKMLSNNVLESSLPSEKILARTILYLREKFVSEEIPFSQQKLSRYTDLNRITVYNIFKKWDENIVSLQNKSINIKNVNALEDIASC